MQKNKKPKGLITWCSQPCLFLSVLVEGPKGRGGILPRLYVAGFPCSSVWLGIPLALLRGGALVQKWGKSQKNCMFFKIVACPL